MATRKYKKLPVSPVTFFEMFRGGIYEISNPKLPTDVKLVDVYLSNDSYSFMFVIESEEFPEVLEGELIPNFEEDILVKKLK